MDLHLGFYVDYVKPMGGLGSYMVALTQLRALEIFNAYLRILSRVRTLGLVWSRNLLFLCLQLLHHLAKDFSNCGQESHIFLL